MRIAFVTFEYPPFIIGGAGIYAKNVTEELAKLGHEVVVFTPEIKTSEETYNKGDIDVKRIKLNEKLPFKALQFWLRLPSVLKEIDKKEKFDVINFNGISYWSLKKRLLNIPHIITVHHLVIDAIKNNKLSLISRILDISGENSILIPIIEKRNIKYADEILASSNFTKNQIVKEYGIPSKKIEVVYLGTNQKKYSFTREELNQTKKQLNIPLEKPIILFVGRIDDKRKGLDILLKAFKQILEKIDSTLLVVGKGDKNKAIKLAKSLGILKNIIFAGFVDELTLKKCYSLCDVYVCPSRLEGFGLTILEAMAAGKPVIASNVGAIPEIIKDSNFLIPPNNDIILSKKILSILSNKKNKLKKLNFDYIKKMTWTNAAKKIVKVYKRFK